MLEKQGEMRFYPHGKDIVVRSGRELAAAGIEVLPSVVARALGDSHAEDYEKALREKRGQK